MAIKKTRARRSKSSIQDSTLKFLPQVVVLSGLTALGTLVSNLELLPQSARAVLVSISLVVSILYLAWIIPRTIDSVTVPALLHRQDHWVYRHSGLFACGVAATLLVFLAVCIVWAGEDEPVFLKHRLILQIIHLPMELGVILCVACLWAPSALQHKQPVMLWKTLSVPLLIAFGLCVVFIPISILVSTLGRP